MAKKSEKPRREKRPPRDSWEGLTAEDLFRDLVAELEKAGHTELVKKMTVCGKTLEELDSLEKTGRSEPRDIPDQDSIGPLTVIMTPLEEAKRRYKKKEKSTEQEDQEDQ